jgi:hypothetical protein
MVHAFERSPPLSPEEIEGWRAWSVVERDGGYVLSSLTRAETWAPGEPFVAACSRKRHDAPARRCSCGVYAASDPGELARLGRIAGAAVGQVSLWGRLVQHSRGYRAGAAYPARVRLVCVVCLGEGHGEPADVVDRDASGERVRLRPLCEPHAKGAALPAARPIEAALLDAYQVDLMPDASVRQIQRTIVAKGSSRRLAAWAVAAVLAVSAIVAVGAMARPPEPSSSSFAGLPPRAVWAHAGRREDPSSVTSDAPRTLPLSKYRYLSPFPTLHCGMITSNDVEQTLSCLDPSADVFVEDVGPAGAHREGTCSSHTVGRTRRGDRILCWRPLPPG